MNNLDLTVSGGGTTHLPWKLDPAKPSSDATRGVNAVDNLERVDIETASATAETYEVRVSAPQGVAQDFVLVISGLSS